MNVILIVVGIFLSMIKLYFNFYKISNYNHSILLSYNNLTSKRNDKDRQKIKPVEIKAEGIT